MNQRPDTKQQMADWKASLEVAAPPDRIYVSMGTNGIRLFTTNQFRLHDGPVTVYIQEAELLKVQAELR